MEASVGWTHAQCFALDVAATFRPANVLSLSRTRPYRAWHATRKRRAKRGAEAPGQRTAARRLLRRVGPPVTLRSSHGARQCEPYDSWIHHLPVLRRFLARRVLVGP